MALPQRIVVVYDGDCRLCQASKSKILSWRTDRIETVPLCSPEVETLLPNVSKAELQREMHVISYDHSESKVESGAEAWFTLMRYAPLHLRWLAYLRYIPGVKQAAALIYSYVAAHRHELFNKRSENLK